MLAINLNSHMPLLFVYSVTVTVQLMDDPIEIPHGQHMKFASFDISSVYWNIPTAELMTVISSYWKGTV